MAIRKVRHQRVKSKISHSKLPRLNVYRSSKYVYAQLIDDEQQATIVAVHSKSVKVTGTKTDQAKEVGRQIAKLAADQNITRIVFDRGGYIYHGRVAAVAEGAREAGLQF